MAKYVVTISYTTMHTWSKEKDHLFDPPKNQNDPLDKERTFKTIISARNSNEAVKNAVISRREAPVECRIYDWTVTGSEVYKLP